MLAGDGSLNLRRWITMAFENLLYEKKEAIERGFELPQEEGLFLEATLFGLCCATEDMREGTRAFLEKRAAQFKGR